jgi:PST family polysaccharide transporter
VPGAELARWQILGVFLRVVSWPLAYILIAKGESLLFALTELVTGIINIGLIFLCMKRWKLDGVGIAFALQYVFYTALLSVVAWRLTDFRWSRVALKILFPAVLVLSAIFVCTRFLPAVWSLCIGLVTTLAVGIISVLALQKLLGVNLWQTLCRKLQPQST